MRTLAPFAGILGGLAWLAALVLDRGDQGLLADVAYGVGVVLLLGATVAAGASLVSRTTTWLRLLVAVCLTLLVWSLVELLAEGAEDRVVHAAVGVVAIVVASLALARRPKGPDPKPDPTPDPTPDPMSGATRPRGGARAAARSRGAHAR